MTGRAIHPNTQAILSAWTRLSSQSEGVMSDPRALDFPGLLSHLFVLRHVDSHIWTFTSAGTDMAERLGRELIDQNFLTLWRGRDMALVSAQLDAIRFGGTPGILRCDAETLTGNLVDAEIALAPIMGENGKPDRMLGLYQLLGTSKYLNGRPVWRHNITALYPPVTQDKTNVVHLFASNE